MKYYLQINKCHPNYTDYISKKSSEPHASFLHVIGPYDSFELAKAVWFLLGRNNKLIYDEAWKSVHPAE